MSEPTLSHDIEEWIKDHSHAAIYASLGRMYATHQLLEDRVAELEVWAWGKDGKVWRGENNAVHQIQERVASLEQSIMKRIEVEALVMERVGSLEASVLELLTALDMDEPQEPRGPHD